MAEPALAHLRLVAATMPGQAGAPPPEPEQIAAVILEAAGRASSVPA
jgi:hypothetical protein